MANADTTVGSNGSGVSSAAESCGAMRGAPGGRLQQLRSENSLGASSSMSEDSTTTPNVGANVTPRPHQWLYKEYKLLEEIGSGGFGRVCK